MDFLPIFLDVRNRKCVIVGGGEVARRKASQLFSAGAALCIVSPALDSQLEAWCRAQGVEVRPEEFVDACLQGASLVIAATDSPDVNRAVSRAAAARDLPVNVVDEPQLCSFIMPAVVDRTPLVVAISSGGTSPVLTRKLKEMNEIMIPGRIDRLARLLGDKREEVKGRFDDFHTRLRFWEAVLDSDIPELVYSGQEEQAERRLREQLADGVNGRRQGEVYLVGAGPGDPDLLTLRALRLMHKADVVLYDRLVSPAVLDKVRRDAEKIHVGKQQAQTSVQQETINQMLVRLAKQGNRVLRLKGGDPFIFGRGGEELESLAAAGISFQVVPGVTAASGCAAYAGIPLTHRDHAHSVHFLTGHLKDGTLDLDWPNLIREQQTLVFYMGLRGLRMICEQLATHGMDNSIPVAVVQQGTTDSQKVLTGQLGTISDLVEEAGMQAPTIIIIGQVVALRDILRWFE